MYSVRWKTAQVVVFSSAVSLLASTGTIFAKASEASVEKEIGVPSLHLDYDLGMPTAETVERLYNQMDFQRAVQSYLWAIPIIGVQSSKESLVENAGAKSGDVVFVSGFRDVSTMRGSNVTTPYFFSHFDLAQGPVVLEYPAGATASSLIDWRDRPIADLGGPGVDAGKGATFLLLGPGQEVPKDAPAGAHVLHSKTFKALLFGRILDNDPQKIQDVLSQARFYPYGKDAPKHVTILKFKPTGELKSMAPPKGLAYWKSLSAALQGEVVEDRDRFFMAMLKPLGIENGQPFAPDSRQIEILNKAAELGEAMAKANAFSKRLPKMKYRPDSNWEYLIPPYYSMQQDIPGGTLFEERTAFFYEVMGSSEAVMTRKSGVGSGYLTAYHDKKGAVLDGGKTYKLHVPANPPAKLFWSITLYDTQSRTFIQSAQQIVDRSSKDDLIRNADGSVDIVMGPKSPAGLEKNWIPTIPGRSWYVYFRLFGPLEPYLDQSWKLSDIELLAQTHSLPQ
ncbi:DUF1254 domain-containing protein [Pseudomonas sp. MWU12-2345]|uniref:DUF1254 domain-containing protein n=1 Tax=Pseudomonas sp. MWU12-2345 TaxID=2928689 RepID=UPI00200F2E76|nr:DUF1254 domain-containing protein [Pseudomonas sp. MWU12-2345]